MTDSVDAWGNPYVYKILGEHCRDSFDLFSMGADGQTVSGGNDVDDVSHWREPRRVWAYYEPSLVLRLCIILFVCAVGVIVMWGLTVRKTSSVSDSDG